MTFASGPMDEFMDPTDGQLDVSHWLLEKRGFLLNPFVITEPAIGYGGGATLLFFHEGEKDKEKRQEGEVLGLPPSISFLVGGGTETDSWLAGGGHFGSYLGDRIRYLGGVGYGEFNIDFYIGDHDIDYTIKGVLVVAATSGADRGLEFLSGRTLCLHPSRFRGRLRNPIAELHSG